MGGEDVLWEVRMLWGGEDVLWEGKMCCGRGRCVVGGEDVVGR